jgi:hypothetical protein
VSNNAPVPDCTGNKRRKINEEDFKANLLNRYYEYNHPTDVNVTMCMILTLFLPKDQVVAAHIIGLHNPESFLPVDLNYAEYYNDAWNGLLLYHDIAAKYANQLIVSISSLI